MNRRHVKITLLFLVILITLAVGIGFWQQAQQRHYAQGRQLIDALVRGDNSQALALVQAGADPNTRYKPTPIPSLFQYIERILHRSHPPTNESPTALMIASGVPWAEYPDTLSRQKENSDDSQLVQAMLAHGGIIHFNNKQELDLLYWVGYLHRSNTLSLLIEHGANVNVKDEDGSTPLFAITMDKPHPDIVRILLEHGAKAEVQGDVIGHSVLMNAIFYGAEPEVIRQLLSHGADPNLTDREKETPLLLAREQKRADIVAILKTAGARN